MKPRAARRLLAACFAGLAFLAATQGLPWPAVAAGALSWAVWRHHPHRPRRPRRRTRPAPRHRKGHRR